LVTTIQGLTIAGTVSEVDQLGTVSQGVVSYSIKIAFDTQDDRIKPDMSVSASIVTNVDQDVLVVPNSAIKTIGGNSIVQTLPVSTQDAQTASSDGITSATGPSSAAVQVGLANDSQTEITSGLNEGDWVVIRTVDSSTASKSTTAQSANSGLRIQGLGTGGLGGGGFGGGFGGGGGTGGARTGGRTGG
jgi:macrolide-specific efflux system membrane fusion protein